MSKAYIAVGSNINPSENVPRALEKLSKLARLVSVSTVYRTKALGRPEQPDYYNLVVAVETDMPPEEFKRHALRRIEDDLGRMRTDDAYAARTIDLDLIVYGELALDTSYLRLPAPDIAARPFLAIPLSELAPELALPGMGRVADLAQKLPRSGMEPLVEFTAYLKKYILSGN